MTCPCCGTRPVTLPDMLCDECRQYLATKAKLVHPSSTRRVPKPEPKPS